MLFVLKSCRYVGNEQGEFLAYSWTTNDESFVTALERLSANAGMAKDTNPTLVNNIIPFKMCTQIAAIARITCVTRLDGHSTISRRAKMILVLVACTRDVRWSKFA